MKSEDIVLARLDPRWATEAVLIGFVALGIFGIATAIGIVRFGLTPPSLSGYVLGAILVALGWKLVLIWAELGWNFLFHARRGVYLSRGMFVVLSRFHGQMRADELESIGLDHTDKGQMEFRSTTGKIVRVPVRALAEGPDVLADRLEHYRTEFPPGR